MTHASLNRESAQLMRNYFAPRPAPINRDSISPEFEFLEFQPMDASSSPMVEASATLHDKIFTGYLSDKSDDIPNDDRLSDMDIESADESKAKGPENSRTRKLPLNVRSSSSTAGEISCTLSPAAEAIFHTRMPPARKWRKLDVPV